MWLTDGTTAGTIEVASNAYSSIEVQGVFNNQLWYTGADGSGNYSLYANNGTSGGSTLVKNLGAGGVAWFIGTYNGKEILDIENSGASGMSSGLWLTDGTAAGTVELASDPKDFITVYGVFNNQIWYTGTDATGNMDLYANNGTVNGTTLVKNFGPGIDASVEGMYNGKEIVKAGSASSGSLWLTNGTTAGTVEIASDAYSEIGFQGVFNNQILYTGNDASGNMGLYANNGTSGGTTLIANFGPGTNAGVEGTYNGKEIVEAENTTASGTSSSLWLTDGTTAGTVEVASDANGTMAVQGVFSAGVASAPSLAIASAALQATRPRPGSRARSTRAMRARPSRSTTVHHARHHHRQRLRRLDGQRHRFSHRRAHPHRAGNQRRRHRHLQRRHRSREGQHLALRRRANGAVLQAPATPRSFPPRAARRTP